MENSEKSSERPPRRKPATRTPKEQSLAAAAEPEEGAADLTPTEEVQRVATEYYGKLSEAAASLTEQSRRLYEMSHEYAREHPVGLIAGAFVAGLLVGLLSNRS